jgi:NADH dehydrogenase (ubiquinone) 1 alpha/beta subcomplex 1
MAIEEEFSIEIPDKEADAIHSGTCRRPKWWRVADANTPTVKQAVDYIMAQPDGE